VETPDCLRWIVLGTYYNFLPYPGMEEQFKNPARQEWIDFFRNEGGIEQ